MLEVFLIIIVLSVWITCSWENIAKACIRKWIPAKAEQDIHNDLRCQVRLKQAGKQEGDGTAFEISICGSVLVPSEKPDVDVQILIADITDNKKKPMPLLSALDKLQGKEPTAFSLRKYIGRTPQNPYVISNWLPIAEINTDLLKFPHEGLRKTKFVISIFSHKKEEPIVSNIAIVDYQNDQPGYIDIKNNHQKSEAVTLQIATALSWSNDQINQNQADVIATWIDNKADLMNDENSKNRTVARLNQLKQESIEYCQKHNYFDFESVSREIADSASIVDRHDLIKLSVQVVAADTDITQTHLILLKQIADYLDIDTDIFRSLAQKFLPVNIYDGKNIEIVLGIADDMSDEQIQKQLNNEYRKWNARVTHPDASIRQKADEILALIAKLRNERIGIAC